MVECSICGQCHSVARGCKAADMNKCFFCNGTGNENKEDGTDNFTECSRCGGTGFKKWKPSGNDDTVTQADIDKILKGKNK